MNNEEPPEDVAAAADINAFIAFLERKQPFDLVGRIVCEASAVELGLIQCAEQVGTAPDALRKKQVRDLVKILKRSPHPSGLVTRELLRDVITLLEVRDVVVHGTPMNVPSKPDHHGFAKHNRDTGRGYYWYGYEESELESTALRLAEIAEVLQSVVLTHRQSAPGQER